MNASDARIWEEDWHEGSDDDSINGLPPAVEAELARRRSFDRHHDDEEKSPASPTLEPLLRDWFLEEEGDPVIAGGFVDLMEKLGRTPRSDDIAAKDPKYNVNRFFHVTETDDQKREWFQKTAEQHASRVRLLRYREFLQAQKSLGLGAPSEFFLKDDDENDENDENKAENEENDDKSSLVNEFDLTGDQILSFAQNFLYGLYNYANLERLAMGTAHCCDTVSPIRDIDTLGESDVIVFNADVSENNLHAQMEELRVRYSEEGLLGPPKTKRRLHVAKVKKRHVARINKCIRQLLDCLARTAEPSIATGYLWISVAKLLSTAVLADPDIARALVRNGTLIIDLCQKSARYATEADRDSTRPKSAAEVWWTAYECWVLLPVDAVGGLPRENGPDPSENLDAADVTLVHAFYSDQLEPFVLEEIKSKSSLTQRCMALTAWHTVLPYLSKDVGMQIAKNKKVWKILKNACLLPEDVATSTIDATAREQHMPARAAAQAVNLACTLCKKGMVHEIDPRMTLTSPVSTGQLAIKMLAKGVVPLLLEGSRSQHPEVVAAAVGGLGQISRIKDCRTLLLQDPRGKESVREMLRSKNGRVVSPALLLVTHLLWDEEWRPAILGIQDPPLEKIIVQWAAFAFQKNLDKAVEWRTCEKRASKEMEQKIMHKVQAGVVGNLQLVQEIKELKRTRENTLEWMEIDKYEWHPNILIGRCALSLSTLNHLMIAQHMAQVGALRFVSCVIDSPNEDTHAPAAGVVRNMQASGFPLTTTQVPDPEHLLYALIYRIEQLAEHEIHDQRTFVFMTLITSLYSQQEWQPYFRQVAKRDDVIKFYVDTLIPSIQNNAAHPLSSHERFSSPSPSLPHRRQSSSIRNQSCNEETGTLKRCNTCRKMEVKAKVMKACSRCHLVYYCGRECQKLDWKTHKKVCGKE